MRNSREYVINTKNEVRDAITGALVGFWNAALDDVEFVAEFVEGEAHKVDTMAKETHL